MRPYLYVALGCLVCAVGGYAFGRYAAPDKVVTVDREVVRVVEDTTAREQVQELTAQLETLKRHTRKERTTVKRPDGTVETKTVEDTHVDKVTDTRKDVDTKTEETTHAETTKEVLKTVTIERARPDWKVSVLAGAGLSPTLTPVYGGAIERRIIGPVFLGVWGLNYGAAGVSLSLEF